jgi:hypothetical protein
MVQKTIPKFPAVHLMGDDWRELFDYDPQPAESDDDLFPDSQASADDTQRSAEGAIAPIDRSAFQQLPVNASQQLQDDESAATAADADSDFPADGPDAEVEQDVRPIPGTTRGGQLYVSGHVCQPWAGPVLRIFFRMIHQMPTRKALIGLQSLFPCIWPVAQTQRQNLKQLAAPFEAHREEIKRALEDPELLKRVVAVLEEGTNREGDNLDAWIQGHQFRLHHSLV